MANPNISRVLVQLDLFLWNSAGKSNKRRTVTVTVKQIHSHTLNMVIKHTAVDRRPFHRGQGCCLYVQFTRILTGSLRNTHTHTHLTALCPGLPRWVGIRKVKPIWILLKQETVCGSGISWAICKSAHRSRRITPPAPHHSSFYRMDTFPAAQPTVSKHWKQLKKVSRNVWLRIGRVEHYQNVCPHTHVTGLAALDAALMTWPQSALGHQCSRRLHCTHICQVISTTVGPESRITSSDVLSKMISTTSCVFTDQITTLTWN